MSRSSMNRREFARLFAAGGSAALLSHPALRGLRPPPLSSASLRRGAVDWADVRSQFLIPSELAVMNAANLCPSPATVMQTVSEYTEQLDSQPTPTFRGGFGAARETTRDQLAAYLRATPEEILITRNTSEGNNWVSSGLDLGPGDEVLIFSDNHPSNNQAWKAKGERFGYTVREVEQVNPHPGMDYYVEAFERALTPNTRVLAFTHFTNTAGDLLPARELCRLARERGVLSIVDGAQSFGLFDVDLSDMQPDFYTGSAHKWPCGPKELGVLYVNSAVHDRFSPSIYSAYTGRRGLSRTHEGMGQRDNPSILAFGNHIQFLRDIGQHEIETRSRELATMLIDGLDSIDGVRMWTPADPALRAAVVTFQPAELDPRQVGAALEADGIVCSTRGGSSRGGIRFSPHFYNTEADIERAIDAIGRYVRQGL